MAYSNDTSTLYYLGTNNMARPRRIRFYKGTSPQFDTGFYEYDGSGNVWAIGNDRYTYDVAGRLISGTVAHGGSHRSEVNAYDGFDNLTQTVFDGNTAQPARFYADPKNRMLGGTAGQVDTVYDQAGRFLFWDFLPAHPGYDAEFLYDALGMQTSFKRWIYDTSTGQWRNENYVDIYGPGNLRLFSWYNQDGSMVYSLRDLGGKILRTYTATGPFPGQTYTFDKDYLYGPEGMWGTYGNGGAKRFFHADHLGTPRQITDHVGTVAGRHNYYPFGSEVPPSGSSYDDRICKYTSHERDRNGATDYMLGRTYFYPVKRFSTVDPGRDGWNLYAYVGGNPVKFVDPDGLEAVDAPLMDLGADAETLRQREIIDEALVGMVAESYEDYGAFGVAISYPVSLLGRMLTSIGAPESNDEVILNGMALGSGLRTPGARLKPRFEASPKHGPKSRGRASAGPQNGQAALDISVQVKSTSPRRVGVDVEAGEFVVFDQTSSGIFHGHVRPWTELTSQMQNVLVSSGHATRKGRILRGDP